MQLPESILVKKQFQTFEKTFKENNVKHKIVCTVRYDDECGNGHNSFSITATIYSDEYSSGNRYFVTGGCIHEEIEKHFPELKHLVKWHLTDSDGPMHYVANATYHARIREDMDIPLDVPTRFEEKLKFDSIPFTFKEFKRDFFKELEKGVDWNNEIITVHSHPRDPETYSDNYSFSFLKTENWYDCPFSIKQNAEEFLEAFNNFKYAIISTPIEWNKAVEPNLEAARSCAVWPDATLEQLQDEKLLMQRLPDLMKEFKKDIEALGFIY